MGRKTDLWTVDRKGSRPECRTAASRLGVGGLIQTDTPTPMPGANVEILVTQDSLAAHTVVQDGGAFQIHRIALSGPESDTPVVSGERCCVLQDADDRHLLFTAGNFNDPLELYIAGLDGSRERQLTHINSGFLRQRDLPTVERLLFPSSDGVEVEGWLLKPPFGQPPFPTIQYIHGGPYAAYGHAFSFDHQMLAGAGYAVLLVNYRGSLGYGDAFGAATFGDFGGLDYQDLMAGVGFAVARGLADANRLGVCGTSNGGTLTCWTIGQTDRFKAAVPSATITNLVSVYGTNDVGAWNLPRRFGGPPHEMPDAYRRCSSITYAHRCRTPTLIMVHELDYRGPAEQAEQFYSVLKANGCAVEMMRFPASSHGGATRGPVSVRRAHDDALLDWMNRYVLGKEG